MTLQQDPYVYCFSESAGRFKCASVVCVMSVTFRADIAQLNSGYPSPQRIQCSEAGQFIDDCYVYHYITLFDFNLNIKLSQKISILNCSQ